MIFLSVLTLGLLTFFGVLSGFYLGFQLSQGKKVEFPSFSKIKQKLFNSPVKNSVIHRTDEEEAAIEERLEQEAEEKEKREKYGLPS